MKMFDAIIDFQLPFIMKYYIIIRRIASIFFLIHMVSVNKTTRFSYKLYTGENEQVTHNQPIWKEIHNK